MNGDAGSSYRFATPAQRVLLHDAGLAERVNLDPASGIGLAELGERQLSHIAFSACHDFYAIAASGHLLAADQRMPLALFEGPEVGPVDRLIAGREQLWVLTRGAAESHGASPCRRLLQFDAASLQQVGEFDGHMPDDIAPDGAGGCWLLAGLDLAHLGGLDGLPIHCHTFDRPVAQIAAAGGTLAAQGGAHLLVGNPRGREPFLALALADLFGTDPGDVRLTGFGEVFLLTRSLAPGRGDGAPWLVLLDSGGNVLTQAFWPNRSPPEAFAIDRDNFVAALPEDGAGVLKALAIGGRSHGRRIMTPALETVSPAGRWLRAEALVRLPAGATLTMRWAATADQGLRRTVEQVLGDTTLTVSARLAQVDAMLAWSASFTYVGPAREPGQRDLLPPELFTLPLHAADGPVLWFDLQLRGNGATAAFEFQILEVIHESESLMDHLPAIYRGSGDFDGTMRRLVGVLEATTQDLDRRIGCLAERLDPQRTGQEWLPGLAAMLGLPFDEALSPEMQRALLGAAPDILAKRGTRDGLLAMLGALLPGRPVRVVDRTEQLIPLTLGLGGALPGLLAGHSARFPKLNARLVLSRTALCPASPCGNTAIAPPPHVLVAIPATRAERRRYGHALQAMIEAMLPAGVRLQLRWTAWSGTSTAVPHHLPTILAPAEPQRLGVGPKLGRGTTGGRFRARLDGAGSVPAQHRLA